MSWQHLVHRMKDVSGYDDWGDLVQAASNGPLTVAVLERGKTEFYHSEPRYDGTHELAVVVDSDAIVFVNGTEVK